MQSEAITEFKWNNGVYSLADMILLVKYNQLTPQQFFEITRLHYEVVKERKGDVTEE